MSDNKFTFYGVVITAVFSMVAAGIGVVGGAVTSVGPKAFDWYTGETVSAPLLAAEKQRADDLQKKLEDSKAAADIQIDTIAKLNNQIADLDQSNQAKQSKIDTYHRAAARKWFTYNDSYVFPGTGLGVYLQQPEGKNGFLIKMNDQPRILTVGVPVSRPTQNGENCTLVASEPSELGVFLTADCKSGR